jgi:hypothetical protein
MATDNRKISSGGGLKYPEKAYLTIIFSDDRGELTHLIPLHFITKDVSDIDCLIKKLENNNQSGLKVSQGAILIPLKLNTFLPVKRNNCKNRSCVYTKWDRMKAFLELLRSPSFYNILVLPSFYVNNKWHFLAEFPFSIASSNKVYEHYIQYSKPKFGNNLKYLAVYSCGKPLIHNWNVELQGKKV